MRTRARRERTGTRVCDDGDGACGARRRSEGEESAGRAQGRETETETHLDARRVAASFWVEVAALALVRVAVHDGDDQVTLEVLQKKA